MAFRAVWKEKSMYGFGSSQFAKDSYERQVHKGIVRDWRRRILGETTDLAKFEDAARQVNTRQRLARRLEYVPLDQIVGSVGRTRDFTREFLPRPRVNPERWSSLDAAVKAGIALPPVELYRIGEVYFVADGNHRTSVARANQFEAIEAYVTEVESPVRLTVADFRRSRWTMRGSAQQAGGRPPRRQARWLTDSVSGAFDAASLGERLVAFGNRLKTHAAHKNAVSQF
jgi:hypothetical protein